MIKHLIIFLLVLTSFVAVSAQEMKAITQEEALELLAQYQNQPDVTYTNPKKIPTMLVYYANWCTYCKVLLPSIAKLEKNYGDKIFIKRVNIDSAEGKKIVKSNKVNGEGVPHIQIYSSDGKLIRNKLGYQSYDVLKKEVELFI